MSQANKIKESDYTSTLLAVSPAPAPSISASLAGLPLLAWKVQEANPEGSGFLIEIKIKPTAGSTARRWGGGGGLEGGRSGKELRWPRG